MTAPKTTLLDYAHWTARAEAAADRCVYEAKARGGNCTVVYGGIGPGLITE